MNPSPVPRHGSLALTSLSIIIPALNEAACLPSTLEAIRASAGRAGLSPGPEVIVIDARSDDDTAGVARSFGARVVSTGKRQRAHQLNLGAGEASGEVLLFLHADTRIPPDGLVQVLAAMAAPVVGGGFVRYFDSPSRFLRFSCRLAAWRSRRSGIFLGDQGIFVARPVFRDLGGFDETLPYGEDLDLSLRLRKTGRTAALEGPLLSSARRFERRGPLGQTLVDLWLTVRLLALRRAGRGE